MMLSAQVKPITHQGRSGKYFLPKACLMENLRLFTPGFDDGKLAVFCRDINAAIGGHWGSIVSSAGVFQSFLQIERFACFGSEAGHHSSVTNDVKTVLVKQGRRNVRQAASGFPGNVCLSDVAPASRPNGDQ